MIAAAAAVNLRVALIIAAVTGTGGAVLWSAVWFRRKSADPPPVGRVVGGVAVCLLIGAVREWMAGGTLYGYPLLAGGLPWMSPAFSVGGAGLMLAGAILGLLMTDLSLLGQSGATRSAFWRRLHAAGRFAGAPRLLVAVGIGWTTLAAWI